MNYIPAYSPIFNPIEMSFYNCPIAHKPKGFMCNIGAWKIKSNYRKLDHIDIKQDIIDSVNTVTSTDLTNYYKHVGKTITEYAS